MKELLKNKYFIIIFTFIMFIFLVKINSYADSEVIVDEIKYIIPEQLCSYEYKFFYVNTIVNNHGDIITQGIGFYFSNSPFVISHNPYNTNGITIKTTDNSNMIFYDGGGSSFSQDYSNKIFNLNNYNISIERTEYSPNFSYDQNYIYYSSHDILNNNNEVVFQAPPQQVEEQETQQPIQQVTIPAIQQVEEIPQGMSQVLQVIIPIGLIVLSIGLVIYLMRLVIYRMQS